MFAKLGHFNPGQCPERAAIVGDLDPGSLSIGIPADAAQEAGSVGDEPRMYLYELDDRSRATM